MNVREWCACVNIGDRLHSVLCECMLCACLNGVRFATNDFCLHKAGFKTWMYIASRMFK